MSVSKCASALFSLSVLFSACTKNPFGDNTIQGGNDSIAGVVRYLDGTPAEDVFVWLDGLDVSTRTDASGTFVLRVPVSSVQGGLTSFNGVFNVYYFSANCRLVSTPIAVKDGRFIYGQGAFNDQGELSHPVVLNKILDITTTVRPDTIDVLSTDPIQVKTILNARVDSLEIYYPADVDNFLFPLILRGVNDEGVHIVETTGTGVNSAKSDFILQRNVEMVRTQVLIIQRGGSLPPGRYEVIPYLVITGEAIPEGLYKALGENVLGLTEEYVNLPFQRQTGYLVVTQ